MKNKLFESELLKIISEENDKKYQNLKNDISEFLSSGLSVRNKKTGFNYTIDSVSMKDVVLVEPDGKKIKITAEKFEEDYEI